jgi:hypothetical protein
MTEDDKIGPTTPATRPKPPLVIKLVCVFAVLADLYALALGLHLARPPKTGPGIVLPDLWFHWMVLSAIADLVTVPFLWAMRKWAAHVFLVLFVLGLAVALHLWGSISKADLIGVVPLLLIYWNYDRMR